MNLEELKALCDAASPQPWDVALVTQGTALDQYAARGPWVPMAHPEAKAQAEADVAFLRAARQHMPMLIEAAMAKRDLDSAEKVKATAPVVVEQDHAKKAVKKHG